MSHSHYLPYFGFKADPFSSDIPAKQLLKLPSMIGVKERLDYSIQIGGIMVVTGDVGSGKSTALRWAQSHYHPSHYLFLNMIANGGSINEFYKQICWAIDLDFRSSSRALILKSFKQQIREIITSKKQKVVLVVDEANLLRTDTLAEIHTLSQFENDSKNWITVLFAGQPSLLDKLSYRTSLPLASRVIAKTHLNCLSADQLSEYLEHHLTIVGIKKNLFSDPAITAIYQGCGGILRKVNSLARGGLIAAATEKQDIVSAEHIRIASTELI